MDDLINSLIEMAQEKQREYYERAARAIKRTESIINDPATADELQAIINGDKETLTDYTCAWRITADSPMADQSIIGMVYYLGYKAGQEAQAQAAADDTNGVDWSGEIR